MAQHLLIWYSCKMEKNERSPNLFAGRQRQRTYPELFFYCSHTGRVYFPSIDKPALSDQIEQPLEECIYPIAFLICCKLFFLFRLLLAWEKVYGLWFVVFTSFLFQF